jgi:hypothetical protein
MFLAEKTVKDYVSSLLALPGLGRRTRAESSRTSSPVRSEAGPGGAWNERDR